MTPLYIQSEIKIKTSPGSRRVWSRREWFCRDGGGYLSPAPQAEPQAVGFSSGLSAAPQAVPHAAAGAASSVVLPHPNRLESAMIDTSMIYIQSAVLLPVSFIVVLFLRLTSTHFFITWVTFL